MAELKQPWYKSVPGILTAATGFIAALSGLVAGLNQLGVFRREPRPEAVVVTAPAPADNTAQDSARLEVTPRPAAPPTIAAPPQPAGAARPSRAAGPASTADTASASPLVLPKGTAIPLSVASRTCAPAEGARRFSARVSAPVEIDGATAIPVGATVALRLRRSADSPPLRARLDSLVRSGRALPISAAQVRIPRGAVSGSCLEPGARLTILLGEPVTLPRR